MTTPDGLGAYERKQLGSKLRLIAWSHRRRFEMGLDIVRRYAGQTVLDWGCGDGTFLRLLMASPRPPREAVGTDIAEDLIADCRRRLGHVDGLRFASLREVAGQPFETVVCMEVLEHVIHLEQEVDTLFRATAPAGRVIISVPVEIGPPVVVKQAVRRLAGWMRVGDYPGTTSYRLPELWHTVFAGAAQHVERPIHHDAQGRPFHDHKGFNWRRLRRLLAARGEVELVRSSPIGFLSPVLASQVWFVVRKPAQ